MWSREPIRVGHSAYGISVMPVKWLSTLLQSLLSWSEADG
jgi:hypothetical protein